MNRTLSLLIILLASLSVWSCVRFDNPESEIVPDLNRIEIDFANSSAKTILDGKKVLWVPGDEISLWDGISNRRFTTTMSGESATFTGTAIEAESYMVLYPYSSGTAFYADSVKTVLPTGQVAVAGSFDPKANLSFGRTTKTAGGTHSGQLKNVGAYLKFSIGSSESSIKKVKFSACGGELISGPVTISDDFFESKMTKAFSTKTINESWWPESKDYVCMSPSAGNFGEGTYYLVFYPSVFTDGVSLTIEYENGTSTTVKLILAEAKRNNVYVLKNNIDDRTFGTSSEGLLEAERQYFAANEGMGGMVTPWSTWTDAASVKQLLGKAVTYGKTYYSIFKYYNYLSGESAESSYGYPMFYGMDFYEATGNYLPRESTRPVRSNIVNTVKKCWARNRAVCIFSWHLESPYAVYSEFKHKMGCRYCYGSSTLGEQGVTYPSNHRYVIEEILDNKKVDTLGITYMGDWFDDRVQEVADMINEFVGEQGDAIPIIFRLWHEQSDAWAWWQYGKHVSLADYISFYKLTVEKFRKKCPNAQILWGYGPDRNDVNCFDYLSSYPGDDYVDIMGYDDYYIGFPSKSEFCGNVTDCLNSAIEKAKLVSWFASNHGKLAAIWETDNRDETTYSTYYSNFVQPMLKDSDVQIAIFQMWTYIFGGEIRRESFKEFSKQDNIIFYPL